MTELATNPQFRSVFERQDALNAYDKAQRRRERTKREVAELHPSEHQAELLAAFDTAVAALSELIVKAEQYNGALADVAARFDQGGVAELLPGDQLSELVYDRQNFPARGGHGELTAVVIEGSGYQVTHPGSWVRAAVCEVAKQRDGLRLPYGQNLAQRNQGQLPALLEVRPKVHRG